MLVEVKPLLAVQTGDEGCQHDGKSREKNWSRTLDVIHLDASVLQLDRLAADEENVTARGRE
jgi:hypothetical protein